MTKSPYPGLRPFKKEEAESFFGREEQIEGLLAKLAKNRFLAVVGPSGCGKSSLVYAGMIPALEMGFMADEGENWRVATLRPGASPMRNLAESLHRALALPEPMVPDAPVDDTAVAFMSAALRRGPSRLAEVFREARLPGDENLLVLVDQFEEIFRYRDQTDADEADAFVELLLAPEREAEGRIYVALTMRSDFLGDCAVFRGLPEAMNDSQFLTPRLTREQRRAAIAGPAGVAGASIEPALVNRMLNEMGDDPDQLPLMQHCLMRMWGMADGASLTLDHYEKTGGLEKALSNHADDVFKGLTPEQQRIAEVLFKRLSERSEGKRDTRRPVRLAEPAKVAGVSVAEAAEVVEAFRAPGRSFLTPPPPKPLGGDKIIDISHESLIRQWGKLRKWAEEEAESADSYRRLEDTAIRREKEGAALWRTPDLDNALRWKKKQQPTPAWAERYGERFNLAMAFLEESEQRQQAEIEAEEKKRQEKLRQARRQLMFALVGLMIAIGLAIWGFWERGRADTARNRAVKTEKARTTDLFESRLTHASLQARVEDYAAARDILEQTRDLDPDMPQERRHARNLMAWYVDLMGGTADKVYEGAGAQLMDVAISPDGKTLAAVGERGTAVLFDEESGEKKVYSEDFYGTIRYAVFDEMGKNLILSSDNAFIVLDAFSGELVKHWLQRSASPLSIDPNNELLACSIYAPPIGDLLIIQDLTTFKVKKRLRGHQGGIGDLVFSPNGKFLLTASADKTSRLWDLTNWKTKLILDDHTNQVSSVAFHHNSRNFATASDKTINLWSVSSNKPIFLLRGHHNDVLDICYSNTFNYLVSASMDRTLRIWDTVTGVTLRVLQGHTAGVAGVAVTENAIYSAANDGTVRRWGSGIDDLRVVDLPGELISSAISPDGKLVAIGFADGKLQVLSMSTFGTKWQNDDEHTTYVKNISFSPDGKQFATASFDNTIKLWQTEDGKLLQTFEGHTAAVHAVTFSPNGKFIASASYDDRIGLFEVGVEEGKFHEAHEGYVHSVFFGNESKTLLSAGVDGAIRLWNIQTWPPELIRDFPKSSERIMWAALSPDNTRIAAVGRDQLVHIYNTETGEEEHAFVGHEQTVWRVEFSADGGQVATVSSDATVRFWDLKTKSELFTINLPSHKSPPTPLWDFSFQCTPAGDCHIAVPLTSGKLVLYRMKGVYGSE